jgi:hypothetical protein
MKTDWKQIREMMNTAIDSCEQIEAAGYTEQYRSASVTIEGREYTVQDFLVSAWTLPESIRYKIVHDRHNKGVDLPYTPESSRIILAMAQACVELIGAKDAAPAEKPIEGMKRWFVDYAVPNLKLAIESAKQKDDAPPQPE